MEKRPILVVLGVLAGAVAFAEAYTWTDENGVVHYSDKPMDGAERIELPGANAARPQPTTRRTVRRAEEQDPTEEPFSYSAIEIASPAAEETLWNIGGTLSVSIALSPALRTGDRIRVYFDGNAQDVSGTSIQLQEVWRGAHNLQAEVIDASGKLMIRSQSSRFYVHQSTVKNAAN